MPDLSVSCFWLLCSGFIFFSFSKMPFSFVLRVKNMSKSLSSSRWFYRAHEEWKLNYHPGSSPLASGRCQITSQSWLFRMWNRKRRTEAMLHQLGPKHPLSWIWRKIEARLFFFFFFYFLHGSYLIKYILNVSLYNGDTSGKNPDSTGLTCSHLALFPESSLESMGMLASFP